MASEYKFEIKIEKNHKSQNVENVLKQISQRKKHPHYQNHYLMVGQT
jgi:hypothetical protein